jgi:signal transduction histidine kinase
MSTVADDDAVLEAQLAHLEAIERRHEEVFRQQVAEPADATEQAPLPEEAWPAAIGEPPPPDGTSLAPLLAWLERARAVLGARAGRNRDELQRLRSQWVHISRNLTRFRADEVAHVVEAQSLVRERIAADETCVHALTLTATFLRAWEALAVAETELRGVPAEPPPAPPADVELVRRLLDDSAADRAAAAARVLDAVLEALAGMGLDMEVVQRQAEREPEAAGELVRQLGERLAGVAEDLRGMSAAVSPVVGEPGEPLHATLRRCAEAHQGRLSVEVAWSGPEPVAAPVREAMPAVVQEFLAACVARGVPRVGIAMAWSGADCVLRLTALAGGLEQPGDAVGDAGAAAEPGWVLRCRARSAVAGGTLIVPAGTWSDVEVRFPDPAGGGESTAG